MQQLLNCHLSTFFILCDFKNWPNVKTMGNTAFTWLQLDISPYQLVNRLVIFQSTWPRLDINPCSYRPC